MKRRRATSIPIDPDKMHGVLCRHRMTLVSASRAIGLSDQAVSAWLTRRRANYYRLDDLACALGVSVEELIDLVEEETP